MKIGDRVEKIKGYAWPGEVRAVLETKAGETRVVVECTHPVVAGALHIFAPEQLRVMGIPQDIADDIKAQYPGVILMRADDYGFHGFGVEYHGVRNAWRFDDTPENWQRAKQKALEWLAR